MSPAPTLPDPQPCASCRAPIVVASTEDGTRVVVEPNPSPNGTVALYNWAGQLRANVVTKTKAAAMRAGGRDMYLAHSLNCTTSRRPK